MRIRCGCQWAGTRCPNPATAEDGLCDWCAPPGARGVDDLSRSSAAIVSPTGELLGVGGGEEMHVDTTRTPDACWLPSSGRTIAGPEVMT